MKKYNKKRIEQQLQERSDEIIRGAKKAHQAFEAYRSKPTLKNYLNYKDLVRKFYEDGSESTVGRYFYTYDQPISMLKTFETAYPKQYKIIVKQLLKEGIDYKAMLKVKNSHLEYILQKQKDRRSIIYDLKDNFKENNKDEYSPKVLREAFTSIDRYITSLEAAESVVINPELTKVDLFKLFKENVYQAQQSAARETIKNAKVINKEDKSKEDKSFER